jgi:hypothetical protein
MAMVCGRDQDVIDLANTLYIGLARAEGNSVDRTRHASIDRSYDDVLAVADGNLGIWCDAQE